MNFCPKFGDGSAFEIVGLDRQTVPLLFNSPHSGRHYPPAFLKSSRLKGNALRSSEDAFVDRLFSDAPQYGAPLFKVHFPRVFLDVNREPYELDPKMFSGQLPGFVNTRSARVINGLGTIAKFAGESQQIYSRPLDPQEGLGRIETLYKPYHRALGLVLEQIKSRFGRAIMIDCHSMPSPRGASAGRHHPDIILGDCHGASCAPALREAAHRILTDLGFDLRANYPYSGGFITAHYGRAARGFDVLQIEINRKLYMDERAIRPHSGFDNVWRAIKLFIQNLTKEFNEEILPETFTA